MEREALLAQRRRECEARLQSDSADDAARYELGLICLQQNNAEQAVAFLMPLATSNAPPVVQSNFGIALSMLERHEESIVALRAAICGGCDDANTHANLGSALYRANRHDEAIKVFGKSLKLNPDDPTTHYNLANCYRSKKDFGNAFFHYRNAIHLNPEYPAALKSFGTLALRRDQTSEAEHCFRRLLSVCPDSNEARWLSNLVPASTRYTERSLTPQQSLPTWTSSSPRIQRYHILWRQWESRFGWRRAFLPIGGGLRTGAQATGIQHFGCFNNRSLVIGKLFSPTSVRRSLPWSRNQLTTNGCSLPKEPHAKRKMQAVRECCGSTSTPNSTKQRTHFRSQKTAPTGPFRATSPAP